MRWWPATLENSKNVMDLGCIPDTVQRLLEDATDANGGILAVNIFSQSYINTFAFSYMQWLNHETRQWRNLRLSTFVILDAVSPWRPICMTHHINNTVNYHHICLMADLEVWSQISLYAGYKYRPTMTKWVKNQQVVAALVTDTACPRRNICASFKDANTHDGVNKSWLF